MCKPLVYFFTRIADASLREQIKHTGYAVILYLYPVNLASGFQYNGC